MGVGTNSPLHVPASFATISLRDTMKLHSDDTQQYQTVTGYDASGVEINAQRFDYSLIVMPEVPPRTWEVARFDDLAPAISSRLPPTPPTWWCSAPASASVSCIRA